MKGHIRQRRPGVYQVMWDIDPDPVTGKRRQRSRTIEGTETDALALLADVQAELDAGTWVDDGTIRVRDLADTFIANRRQRWTPGTENWYHQKLAYLVEAVGHRKASQVSGGTLTGLYGNLSERGLSPSTVAAVHRAARAMFRAAVKWGYLRADPSERAEPPTARSPEMAVWSADELRTFLEGTAEHQLSIAWQLIAFTGIRRGELAGLEWPRVDLEGRTITISKSVTAVNGQVYEGRPKTASGRRTIALDDLSVEVCRGWRRAQVAQRLAATEWHESGRVVTWADGRPVHPDIISKTFRRTSDRLSLPHIRLHDLRHTYATLGLEAGVDVRVMADRLGHSSPAITMAVYQHVTPKLDRDAAEAIAQRLR